MIGSQMSNNTFFYQITFSFPNPLKLLLVTFIPAQIQPFFLITLFATNRIDLKILDFLSYTYTHPIQLQNFKNFNFSSVNNHPKLTKISKNG